MNASKSTNCPFCVEGTLHLVKRDYVANIGDGQKHTIPNIEMEVCDKCGEEILSLESAREIDAAIAEHTERLMPEELREIREWFNVAQDEMSEALGLGAKTFHRWEKGSQYPSRSMGYYLRMLREFPEAFEWLRSRQWRGRNRIVTSERSPLADMQRKFPQLPLSRLNALITNPQNCALIFFNKK
jgi:putative zinc finger/helix-turn-helix YgiT family protein